MNSTTAVPCSNAVPLAELARVRRLCESGEGARIRREAHIALSELGAACAVNPATVGAWEHGQTPRGERAVRYLHLLDELAAVTA